MPAAAVRIGDGELRAGRDGVCAHALDLGEPRGRREAPAPVASVDFAPGSIWSVYDSPRLKARCSGPRVPQWLKRLQFWVSDRLFVLPLVGRQLNGLRRELGLAPVRRVFWRVAARSAT